MKGNPSISTITACAHCGNECASKKSSPDQKNFCCEGCKMVYAILQSNNLCEYYNLNEHPGLQQNHETRSNKFDFLDSQDVIEKLVQFNNDHITYVQFYLPQMHCSSCVWLLEQLHLINEGVQNTKVNFIQKEVFIAFDNQQTTLRKVVECLAAIGYEPHINLQNTTTVNTAPSNKKRLIKIAIAGFCFTNIMMLSFPHYLSGETAIEPIIQNGLQIIALILSFPVLFYAAKEFFESAFNGLKNKYINIDTPVALAIVITFFRSLYEIATHQGSGYLDSMSGIVFFMLIGRWLQEKTYQSISFDRDYKSFFPIALQVIKDDKATTTLIQNLQINDLIIIHNNEVIPADSIVSKGNCLIDYSFVTGEQKPVQKNIGDLVYAGGKQINGKIELLVVKPVSQSYLTTLWNNEALNRKKKPTITPYDAVGKYFTYAVLCIGIIAATFWLSQNNYGKMWNALTTVLIVACPCALLLSSNYSNGNTLRILGRNKFYLRNVSVLLELKKLTHIVFDKTGTLTCNEKNSINYFGKLLCTDKEILIASILSNSNHPLSKAIVEHLNCSKLIDIPNFKESIGDGVEAWVNDQHIKIGSKSFIQKTSKNDEQTTVHIKFDDEIWGNFRFKNVYRLNIFKVLNRLKTKFNLSIISGDNASEARILKKIITDPKNLKFNQSPHDKLEYIKTLQHNSNNCVAMIGDGLNDAGALKISDVGIAITESNNNFTPACDAILNAENINLFPSFLRLIQANTTIIYFTFCISAIYNIIGLWFAIQGILSPLVAAILMPLSSITIIFLTYYLTTFTAKKLHLKT